MENNKLLKELLSVENFIYATRIDFTRKKDKTELKKDIKMIKVYIEDIEKLLKEEGE